MKHNSKDYFILFSTSCVNLWGHLLSTNAMTKWRRAFSTMQASYNCLKEPKPGCVRLCHLQCHSTLRRQSEYAIRAQDEVGFAGEETQENGTVSNNVFGLQHSSNLSRECSIISKMKLHTCRLGGYFVKWETEG
jgi:hypothetical protein